VFISSDIKKLICNLNIVDSCINTSDHLPVAFCFTVPSGINVDYCSRQPMVRDYRWDKGDKCGYYYDTGTLLSKINHQFYCDCSDTLCSDSCHLMDINIYYSEITFALTQAANVNIPKIPKSAIKHYWSIALEDLKNIIVCRHTELG